MTHHGSDHDSVHDTQPVIGVRPGRMRDRRARGQRGPLALPGPLSAGRVPRRLSRNQRFDRLVETVVAGLETELRTRRPPVEIVIDHAPLLPDTWDDEVPLCTVVEGQQAQRLVVFRRPHLERAAELGELTEMVRHNIAERLAEIWRINARDLRQSGAGRQAGTGRQSGTG